MGGTLSRRVLRCGFVLAVTGAVIQASLHLLDVYALDGRVDAINSDNAGEGNVFTWASSSATFAAALFCLLLALVETQRRALFGCVAGALALFSLDDAMALHERAGEAVLRFLDISVRYSRLSWPVLLLPLMALIALTIWRYAAHVTSDERRALRGGIVLLGLAVALEVALFPAPHGSHAREILEPSFVAAEESIELAGWIVIAAGLASVVVRQIALDSQREAADRRGRDDHPARPALIAGERRLRGLRRG
jgi:hypothetical protein